MYPIKQSTAITIPFFAHDSNGDAVTGLTDVSFTKRISKNGAAFGAMTVTITEQENGWYSFPLSTSHSDTLGLLTVIFTNAGSKQVNLQWRVEARLTDDVAYPTVSGRSLDVTATGEAGLDLANVAGVLGNANVGWVDGSDRIQVTEAQIDQVVDEVWDEAISGHVGVGSFGEEVQAHALSTEVSALNDLSAAQVNAEVDTALADYDGPTDAEMIARTLVAASYATAANQTTLLNRIGAFTGTGFNTILGFFQALMRSDATTPSDLGGTYDDATDSVQAIRDQGDAAWTTATSVTVSDKTGFSLSAAGIQAIWDALTSALVTVGSIGKLLVDNVNATISSRSSHSASDVTTDVDANSTQLTAIVADTNELQGDWADAGRLDAILDARASQTTADAIETDTQDIQSRLPASLVSGRMSSDMVALSGSAPAADNLEASALTIVSGAAIAGTLSTTQMTTDLTEATDDHYNGRLVIWTSGALKDQYSDVTDYDGGTKMLTYTAITEAPLDTDTFILV